MSNISQKSDADSVKRFAAESHVAFGSGLSSDLPDALDIEFKRLAVKDLKECRWSREEVCIRVSHLVGRQITTAMLDAFLAESKTHRMPASMIPAWVQVTGSHRLLKFLCESLGMYLVDQDQHDLIKFGSMTLQVEKAQREVSNLKAQLWDKV